jgi:hypothetical protein
MYYVEWRWRWGQEEAACCVTLPRRGSRPGNTLKEQDKTFVWGLPQRRRSWAVCSLGGGFVVCGLWFEGVDGMVGLNGVCLGMDGIGLSWRPGHSLGVGMLGCCWPGFFRTEMKVYDVV